MGAPVQSQIVFEGRSSTSWSACRSRGGSLELACPACGRAGAPARCAFCGVARQAGAYSVERVLAQGPHGRVYRAHARDGSVLALKELQFASVPENAPPPFTKAEQPLITQLEIKAVVDSHQTPAPSSSWGEL